MADHLTLVDLDVYGRNEDSGLGLRHEDDFAVSNAIILYCTSDANDFLFNPGKGLGLKVLAFKNITESKIFALQKSIEQNLSAQFDALATDFKCEVNPFYEDQYIEIIIVWSSTRTGDPNKTQFFVSVPPEVAKNLKLTNSNDKIAIDFAGDNLIAFVILKLEDASMRGKLLIFDTTLNQWVWGSFSFTNLTSVSPEFATVSGLIEAASS